MGVKQGGTHAVQDDRLALRKRRPSLVDAACENIRASILSGVNRPGAQLPTEAEFVDVLGVSRTVIREAITRLAAAGLVEDRQAKGIFDSEHARCQAFPTQRDAVRNIRAVSTTPDMRQRREK